MQIETFRARLDEFSQNLGQELYNYYSGLREQPELRDVYSDFSDLFSSGSIREVQSELNDTGESFSSRRRSLIKIHAFLINGFLDYRAAALTQEILRLSGKLTFSWNGNAVSLSQVSNLLQNERNPANRRKLSDLYAGTLGDSEEAVQDKLALLRSTAKALGFKSYVHAKEYISGVNYAGFLDGVDEVLGSTADSYLERLRISVESTLGIALQEAGSWDVARWRRLNEPVNGFPAEGLLPVLDATLEELNIRPEDPNAISFDLECRPGKHTRPICIPVRVPWEVKVLMCPGSGARHYSALLHESGHAYHFAWTNGSLPSEHRLWGDRALSESYGFLFERFLLDPEWLSRRLSLMKSEDFLRFQWLYREFMVRRWAGRLRFALQLYREESPEDLAQVFADTLKSYTGFLHHPQYWLAGAFDSLADADYMRGWILECVLREYLCRRHGKAWMRSRSAAGFLKEIWETGQLYSADELAREIGVDSLDPQILADDLSGGLQY